MSGHWQIPQAELLSARPRSWSNAPHYIRCHQPTIAIPYLYCLFLLTFEGFAPVLFDDDRSLCELHAWTVKNAVLTKFLYNKVKKTHSLVGSDGASRHDLSDFFNTLQSVAPHVKFCVLHLMLSLYATDLEFNRAVRLLRYDAHKRISLQTKYCLFGCAADATQ